MYFKNWGYIMRMLLIGVGVGESIVKILKERILTGNGSSRLFAQIIISKEPKKL